MLRHIFIINVKEGISDDVVEQKMAEMRAMKEIETVIEDIMVVVHADCLDVPMP